VYSHFGYNLKVTDMQAAVGCEQLKKLPQFIKRRRHNWERLRAALAPLEDRLILPEPVIDGEPSWFGFLITLRDTCAARRENVVRHIESRNIQTRLLFSGNLIRHPCFDELRGTDAYRVVGELRNTDTVTERTFWVGVYLGLTDERIDYMASVIRDAVTKG
jgi:dTDP-4-amino-4,6-dideoxygalactose transaminase